MTSFLLWFNSNYYPAGDRVKSTNRSLPSPAVLYQGPIYPSRAPIRLRHLLPDELGSISTSLSTDPPQPISLLDWITVAFVPSSCPCYLSLQGFSPPDVLISNPVLSERPPFVYGSLQIFAAFILLLFSCLFLTVQHCEPQNRACLMHDSMTSWLHRRSFIAKGPSGLSVFYSACHNPVCDKHKSCSFDGHP